MKVGDTYTATVDNKTPGGLLVTGEIVELTDTLITVATQFGVRMTLPRPQEPAIVDG